MRIACIGYRDWAIQIYKKLSCTLDHEFLLIQSEEEYKDQTIRDYQPDLVLFYGWSRIVRREIVKQFTCLMLHPSRLPEYRGGSPIQNQIIRGVEESAVTILVMDEGIDTGPIVAQAALSLLGSIDDIFDRISKIGYELTCKLIKEGLRPVEQDHAAATEFKRRSPSESEITKEELMNASSSYLYNKIRMLQSPYPNAFIRTSDGKKLYIIDAWIAD